MGRKYEQTFEAVTVSAAQDLVFLPGSTGHVLRILRHWVNCGDTSLATGQGLKLRCRRLPAAVTAGTGGTTGATPTSLSPGDAACSTTTAGTNNTGKATSSGTVVVIYEGACHLYQGEDRRWDFPPEIGPTAAFVYELLSTVSGTVTLSGGVEFEELG